MENIKEAIEQILHQELSPSFLEVLNTSHEHAGHAGNPGGGQTHFTVRIQSEALQGKPLVTAHRTIYKLLAPYMDNPIHALKIELIRH